MQAGPGRPTRSRACGYDGRVGTDELEAAFTLRWGELGLDETPQAGDATIRPTIGATLAAVDHRAAATDQLPRISLDRSEARLPERPVGHTADLHVVSTLGEGGMGRVHLARQRSLDREVAVKTLKPGAPDRARAALLGEATVTGSLEHPGIIPVHALGLDDAGRPVLVMKRVEGTEWRTLVYDPEHPAWSDLPLSEERLDAHVEILLQVCNALHFAHSRGIVHGDVKPENVMVGRFGEVYLVDWGVASRMEAPPQGELVGSPGYMAPEMVTGAPVDARTDVYLLGATLHEVLTGELRHSGDTLQQILFSAFRTEPCSYPEDVPQELADLCNRATSREPAERLESAHAFRQALLDFRRHRTSVTLAAGAAERLRALGAALPSDPEQPVEDTAAAYRLATECRFAYTQALEEWPDNPTARRGLEDCIATSADLELRQGNAAGARALLAELGTARPKLNERLDVLEREQREQRERDARLRRLEHDMDVGVGAASRARALLLLALLAAGVSTFALLQGTADLETSDMVVFALVILGGALVGLAASWRQLLANAFNRKAAGIAFLAIVALAANRTLAHLTGTEVHDTFIRDLSILCAIAATASITLASWAWPAAVIYGVSIVLGVLLPAHIPITFSVSSLLVLVYLAIAWRHGRR